MQHLESLLKSLAAKGIRLSVEGENLSITGKKANLTPDLIAAIKGAKAELVAYLGAAKTVRNEIPQAPSPYPASNAQKRLWLIE